MGFGIVLHLLDFFIREAGGRGDVDLLFLAGAQVFCGNMNNAVGVNVEGDLNLRYAPRSRRDVGEFEAAEGLVVSSHRTFALEDMNVYGRLVVCGGGEYLGLGGRDGGISLDHGGEYAAQGFDAQGERGHVQQEDVFDFAFEDAGLDSCAYGYGFVRVYALGRFFAEFIFNQGLYSGDTRGAADQEDFVDVAYGNAGIFHSQVDRFYGSLYQVFGDSVEFSTGEGGIEVNRHTVGVHGDEWQVDIGGHDAGEFDLCFFAGFFQTLVGHGVSLQFEAILCFEFVSNPVHDAGIEVVAAQVAVAVGCFYFEYAISEVQDGNIECAAAQIVYEETVFLAVFDFVQAISQGGSGRFVDDTEDVQTCNLAGIFGSLALCVGEVSRAGDNGIGNFFAQVCFCVYFQFLQNHSGDFLWGVGFVINGDFVIAAHVSLDGNDGAVRVGNSLALCQLADQSFAGLGEAYHRRSQTRTFRVRDNDGFAAFHDSYDRVCSTEVNTNNFRHLKCFLSI